MVPAPIRVEVKVADLSPDETERVNACGVAVNTALEANRCALMAVPVIGTGGAITSLIRIVPLRIIAAQGLGPPPPTGRTRRNGADGILPFDAHRF